MMRTSRSDSATADRVDPNAPTFRLTIRIAFAVCGVFSVVFLLLGDSAGALIILLALLPIGIGAAMHRTARGIRVGVEILNTTAFGVLMWLSYRGGGLQAPTVAWLVVVPYVSISIGYYRSAVTWLVAVAAGLGWFWYLEATTGPLPAFLGNAPNLMRAAATAGLFAVILSFLYLVERARRRAFAKAQRATLDLEVRNAELAAARDEALAAADAKSRFLANMSHEIRTPLNGMLGMTELLIDTPLSESQRSYAQTAYRSGRALLVLLNDILDFSKNEAGKLDIEHVEFDLREVVEDVASLQQQVAEAKGLDLTWHVDALVPRRLVGDAGRLRQIVTNIVGNAVKFTLRGGIAMRVSADVAAAADEGATNGAPPHQVSVRFEVQDTGIGIDPSILGRLFQPFSQADESTTRRFGGTGLGLAICRQLAEAMGGTISVASEADRGSTFVVELPFRAAPGTVVPPAAPAPSSTSVIDDDLRGLRVLVAEDNRVNQLLEAAMLNRLGCVATVVADGLEAVDVCLRGQFDLVLMDCHMPGIDGFEATIQLRAAGKARLPIIAVTADALEGDRERCLAGGMDDYLAKPFGQSDLAATLRRWLPQVMAARSAQSSVTMT